MKTILLLHGWNYRNYTSLTNELDAWHNRVQFCDELSKHFKIYKLNFPGFCGEKEPKSAWNLDDYARFVHKYIISNKLKIDYLVGYSFGGAVATRYNTLINNEQKLILISPAIIRNNNKSHKFINTPKFLIGIRKFIRNIYLTYIIKNNETKYGTKFLKNSYQNIVREDLLDEINKINYKLLTIIYGENDNMVNPDKVILDLDSKYNIKVIKNGGHDIANTNTIELVNIICKLCK